MVYISNNNSTEDISNQVSDELSKNGKRVTNRAKKIGKRLAKSGLKSIKMMGWIGGGGFLGALLCVFGIVVLLDIIIPSSKTYTYEYINNTEGSDTIITNIIDDENAGVQARSGVAGMVGEAVDRIVRKEVKIELSEENQAIENYHYYNALKSLSDNKYYMPLKDVDLSGLDEGTVIETLLNKGVLKVDDEENQLIFDEKYIGNLEKVTDESKKKEVTDEYNREAYFQLPEELLGVLNMMSFREKIIYDKAFLQGVAVKYSKSEDTDLGRPMYKFSTDGSNIDYKTNGLGSVFIYKPSFEFGQSSQVNEIETTEGKLVYMGDSLFVGMQQTAGVPAENVVATTGHNLVKGLEVSVPEVVKKKPSAIVMDYGSNDAADGVEKYRKRYIELIKKIKDELPGVKIYLTKLYNKFAGQLNGVIEEIAKEAGVNVIDSSSIFKKEYLEQDQVHYTANGYKAWRKDIESKIFGESGKDDSSESDEENKDEKKDNASEAKKVKEEDSDSKDKKEEKEENDSKNEEEKQDEIKVKYLLDTVITFAGVYKFEYEVETNIVDGKIVSQKEVPKDIINQGINNSYAKKYLGNLKVEVPKNFYNKYRVRYLINAFKGAKNTIGLDDSEEASSNSSSGGALEGVEKWRSMVEPIAEKWGIDPALILALMHSESGGNPHAVNGSFQGLFQAGADGLMDYFKKDSKFQNFSPANRIPSCPKNGPHSQHEHDRIGEFQIEFAARKLSAQMGYYLKVIEGLDYKTDEISIEALQNAIFFTCAAHQTGEYGQLVAVDYHGPEKLYSNKGHTYEKLFVEYINKGGKYMYAKSASVKKIKKSYRFNGIDNKGYMKKAYEHYPLYSGGVELDEITKNPERLAMFDQSKWFEHPSYKAAGGTSSGENNSDGGNDFGLNGLGVDSSKVSEYMKFEEGLIGNKKGTSSISVSLSGNEVDLLLEQVIGMMDGEMYSGTSSSKKTVFWKKGYEKMYFSEGKAIKPPSWFDAGDGIWGDKIQESGYNGDINSLRNLAKLYGEGLFKVINRLLNQNGMPYKENGIGVGGFDMAGLIWYGFNYGEEKTLFEKGTIAEYAEKFKNQVEEEDLRPGDVSFFSKPGGNDREIVDAIIYLGNDAGLYVNEEMEEVEVCQYSIFKGDSQKRIYAYSRRILKFSSGLASDIDDNKSALSGMPEGFVEDGYAFPILVDDYSTVWLRDGVGVRKNHPSTGRPNIPHFGVDYSNVPIGTPIVATKDGIVLRTGYGQFIGWYVVLDHLDGSTSAYYHLNPGSIKVSAGQTVKQGDQIAGLGSSGRGTGPHLHFEIAVGLPNHTHGAKKDMRKFVPIQDMFKDLGITDMRKKPIGTIYPGNEAHWQNRNP